jgi:hypothetical protein
MQLAGLAVTRLAITQASAAESRLEVRANDVLNEAHDILLQREARYDDFHVTAIRTASIQSVIHEERRTPEAFCLDMVAVKLARIYNSPDHLDNYLDAICYLAEAAALVKMKEVE